MPNAETGSKGDARQHVSVSSTAANMLSSLFNGNSSKMKATVDRITSDISDPNNVKKIYGYDNMFVARGHGIRVVYQLEGDTITIISVSVDP